MDKNCIVINYVYIHNNCTIVRCNKYKFVTKIFCIKGDKKYYDLLITEQKIFKTKPQGKWTKIL